MRMADASRGQLASFTNDPIVLKRRLISGSATSRRSPCRICNHYFRGTGYFYEPFYCLILLVLVSQIQRMPIDTRLSHSVRKNGILRIRFTTECNVSYRIHPSGQGLVETTATVEDTVFVDRFATVRGTATVSVQARIQHRAVVSGNACISGFADLDDDAKISGSAFVYSNARILDNRLV